MVSPNNYKFSLQQLDTSLFQAKGLSSLIFKKGSPRSPGTVLLVSHKPAQPEQFHILLPFYDIHTHCSSFAFYAFLCSISCHLLSCEIRCWDPILSSNLCSSPGLLLPLFSKTCLYSSHPQVAAKHFCSSVSRSPSAGNHTSFRPSWIFLGSYLFSAWFLSVH